MYQKIFSSSAECVPIPRYLKPLFPSLSSHMVVTLRCTSLRGLTEAKGTVSSCDCAHKKVQVSDGKVFACRCETIRYNVLCFAPVQTALPRLVGRSAGREPPGSHDRLQTRLITAPQSCIYDFHHCVPLTCVGGERVKLSLSCSRGSNC